MGSIRTLWKDNSAAITGIALVLAVLLTGSLVSIVSNSSLGGMQSSNDDRSYGGVNSYQEASNSDLPGPSTEDDAGSGTDERKRVERIYMDFETPDVEESVLKTKEKAEIFGGYPESENYNRENGETASVTVRIPEENVSTFLNDIENRGEWSLQEKDRNVNDLTDRYQELELELENKRQELQRLEELMNQTEDVEKLISIQERMGELRTRIQYLDNELNDIDQKVDYTRIKLSFEEPEPLTAEFNLHESFVDGYRGIFKSLRLAIVGTGYLLPFAVIYGIYRLAKRWKRRK